MRQVVVPAASIQNSKRALGHVEAFAVSVTRVPETAGGSGEAARVTALQVVAVRV